MDSAPIAAGSGLESQLREMNEALVLSSLRLHESAERAQIAEAAARTSEAQFRSLFDSIDEGFCEIEVIFDAAGTAVDYQFLQANPALEKQSGLHDVVGRTINEILPALEQHWRDLYGRVALTGESIRVTAEIVSLGRTLDLFAFRVGGSESRRVGVLFTDVTDRARMEQRLRESEVRYRRLFQSSKDGILLLDAETGTVIDANVHIGGLLGVGAQELVGKPLAEIGVFADPLAGAEAFSVLQREGYIRYDHLPLRRPAGEKIEVEFVSNVYTEGERKVAQCTIRDISARVALERKVKLQTEALAETARHKDELLAMLSHELRNPLAPIRSAAHLLRLEARGNETPIQQQAREVIERQVSNMSRLVSDLMEVSRVLTGQVRLTKQPVDLNRVVLDAVETVTPLVGERNHKLMLRRCEGQLWLSADATRMEQVLVNLLTNAAKYTDIGGRIDVTTEAREGCAIVTVRDNGAGIDSALLPRIFDLFTQSVRTLDRSQGGLGIGLSLANQLVALHGGTISAASDGKGKGSEFVVKLPLLRISEPKAPASLSPGAMSKRAIRVLVVDDNTDSCLLLAKVVQLRGDQVRTAHTGPTAVDLAESWRPDVVLLDIGLPGFDGFEVARRIRALPELKDIKLVAVTGYGSVNDIAHGQEAGFDVHMVKPVDIGELDRMLTGWRQQA